MTEKKGPAATGPEKPTGKRSIPPPAARIKLQKAAAWYAAVGWYVLPIEPRGKRPLARLVPHGLKDATTDAGTIAAWWADAPDANVGIACAPSEIIVLDFDVQKPGFDGKKILDRLLRDHPTVTARTGGGGWHLVYRQPDPPLGDSRGGLPAGIDVRGKGYIVAPPSVHPSGGAYAWEQGRGPHQVQVAPLPDWVREILRRGNGHDRPTPPQTTGGQVLGAGTRYALAALEAETARVAGASPGQRNNLLNEAAYNLGQLVGGGQLDRTVAEQGLVSAAIRAGLPEAEARRTTRSGIDAGQRHPRAPEDAPPAGGGGNGAERAAREKPQEAPQAAHARETARDTLYRLARSLLDVGRGTDGIAYATLTREGHRETHPVRSGPVRALLSAAYQQERGTSPGAQALQDVLGRIIDETTLDDPRPYYYRVARHDAATWIDPGWRDWELIRVTPGQWQVVTDPPADLRFFRRPNLGAMPRPQSGKDGLEILRQLLPVRDEDWPLVVAWAVHALRGEAPFPVMVLTGEAGTAKSTVSGLLKCLVDPSAGATDNPADTLLRGAPRDVDELMVAAANSWVLAYDNLSRLSPDLSDALCRIATSGSHTKRRLYSDADEVIIHVTRPVIVNGITDFVTRQDLLDRAVVIDLPPIQPGQRIEASAYWQRARQALPHVLQGLLDLLAEGLRWAPETPTDRLSRMAAYERLGEAIGPALGLEPGTFRSRYADQQDGAVSTLLEGSVLATPLRRLALAHGGTWTGSAADLLSALRDHASLEERESRQWPRSARALGMGLRREAPALRRAGLLDVERARTARGHRSWRIRALQGGE